MHIGFDGKRVVQNFTGLGNYSRYVLNIITRYFPDHSYTVYTSKIPGDDQKKKLGDIHLKYPDKKKFAPLWRTFFIVTDIKKDGVDLYHGLSNELPVGLRQANIASVVTIHDLIFLRYPHYYRFVDRTIYYYKAKYACKNADGIIAISEQTKRDIIHYLKIPEDKINVLYQNCDAIFRQKVTLESKERIRLTHGLPEKFILNVGTIEPRKNLMLIAKSLKYIPDNIDLVVVGKETTYATQVKNYLESVGLSRRVRFLKNVPFTDLPGIYQLSEIFIYPSKFEGFGIPVIEALHSGIPVIVAGGSCLEEAGGPDSYYVNPEDEVQLADYINLIIQKPDIRDKMIEKGYQYVKKFDDKTIAEELINIYQKAINNDERRSIKGA